MAGMTGSGVFNPEEEEYKYLSESSDSLREAQMKLELMGDQLASNVSNSLRSLVMLDVMGLIIFRLGFPFPYPTGLVSAAYLGFTSLVVLGCVAVVSYFRVQRLNCRFKELNERKEELLESIEQLALASNESFYSRVDELKKSVDGSAKLAKYPAQKKISYFALGAGGLIQAVWVAVYILCSESTNGKQLLPS